MNPPTTGELIAYFIAFVGSTYGFLPHLLSWIEQRRKSKQTDAVLEGEARVLASKAEALESEAQTGIAEASNKLAEASKKLAESTGQIADIGQRLIDQLSLALSKSEEFRRIAESELAITRKTSAEEVRALRDELAQFKEKCDKDKLKLELAIGHLQSEIEKMHKSTPE